MSLSYLAELRLCSNQLEANCYNLVEKALPGAGGEKKILNVNRHEGSYLGIKVF